MFYVFVLVIGVLAIAAYLLVIFREVPGAVDERLGKLEDLPADLGEWKADEETQAGRAALAAGRLREVRLWREASSGFWARERIVEQVRYRNLTSGAIEGSEPDRPLRRRRVKG